MYFESTVFDQTFLEMPKRKLSTGSTHAHSPLVAGHFMSCNSAIILPFMIICLSNWIVFPDRIKIFSKMFSLTSHSSTLWSCYIFCSGKRSLKPRVILLTYPTSLSMQGQQCSDFVSIEDRAKLLVQDLSSLDLNNKPTVFIGHSMGGLIIKSMLIQGSGRSTLCYMYFLVPTCFYPKKPKE